MSEISGNIIIIEPESRFKKVEKTLIENPSIDCLTLGIYTKLIVLGAKWQLNIKGLRNYLGLSDDRIRKSLVLLEQEGYVLRTPARSDGGKFVGWNYTLYPVPISEEQRSRAGIKVEKENSRTYPKTDNTVNGQVRKRTSPKTDNTENGEHYNNRLNITNRLNINIETTSIAEKVQELWNGTCVSFGKIIKVTESRKAKIKTRVQEMGGEEKAMEVLTELFGKMEASDFLKGNNGNKWKATFDWVFDNDKNWLKVIEGNYDRQQNTSFGNSERRGVDDISTTSQGFSTTF